MTMAGCLPKPLVLATRRCGATQSVRSGEPDLDTGLLYFLFNFFFLKKISSIATPSAYGGQYAGSRLLYCTCAYNGLMI